MEAAKEQQTREADLFKEFMKIMGQNGMTEQSQDFRNIYRYLAGMQVQMAIMVEELQGMREQLAQIQENQPKGMKEKAVENVEQKTVENVAQLERKVTSLSERLGKIKDSLVGVVAQAVSAFHQKGKQEMNKVLQKGISGVKSMLETFREQTVEILTDYEKTANQIDSIGDELKQAGNSIANVGRLLSGKGAKEVSDEKQGVALTRAMNRPVKKHIAKLKGKLDRIDGICEKLDSFQEKLEPKKEEMAKEDGKKEELDKGDAKKEVAQKEEVKKERVSVKEKLSEMKAKTGQPKKQPEPAKRKEECL